MQRIRVVHIIPDLATGGAETALVRLLEGLDRARFASLVVTLRDGGALVPRARAAAERVVSLEMRSRLPSPGTIVRLRAALNAFAPDVLQGWMYHGNLAAWAGANMLGKRPALAWNIRQSLESLEHERGLTRLVIRANVRLSRRVERVVSNAHSSVTQHTALGFAQDRFLVIPNGFDTEVFRPNAASRAVLRAQLRLAPDTLLAGLVARFDPVKRHDLFLAAVAGAVQSGVDVHAVLVGPAIDAANAVLARMVADAGLGGRVHLLGERSNVERVLQGLDVLVSASGWAEGFPNVVGEAMACGVPCIVTDTGDCAAIVGDAGCVVPPRDGRALGTALRDLLRTPVSSRAEIGAAGSRRIVTSFSLATCVARYAALYEDLVRQSNGGAATAPPRPRSSGSERSHAGLHLGHRSLFSQPLRRRNPSVVSVRPFDPSSAPVN